MNLKFIRKRMVAVAFTGVILAPAAQALAAEATSILEMPQQNKEVSFEKLILINAAAEINNNTNLDATIKIESTEEIRLNEKLLGKSFAVIGEEGFLPVNAEADANSAFTGKVYEDSVIKVIERMGEWSKIRSGNVEGFIKAENIISGKAAEAKAKEILTMLYPDINITILDVETIDGSFTVGETIEEEHARLEAEEAARIAKEQAILAEQAAAAEAALVERRQAIVSYAGQFIGNPYVFGGTSLTRGTDCSGFVRGVYAHFGVSLPRTSYSMRSVGYEVSYSDIQPGDIVCYAGHVGIYAGNGQIVNAIDESRGIGMSNAKYTKIITIRRIF